MNMNSNRRKVLGVGVAATLGSTFPLGTPLFAQSKKTVIRLADQAGAAGVAAQLLPCPSRPHADQLSAQRARRPAACARPLVERALRSDTHDADASVERLQADTRHDSGRIAARASSRPRVDRTFMEALVHIGA